MGIALNIVTTLTPLVVVFGLGWYFGTRKKGRPFGTLKFRKCRSPRFETFNESVESVVIIIIGDGGYHK